MKTMIQNNYFKVSMLLTIGALLSACSGGGGAGTTDLASRASVTDTSSLINYAQCNSGSSSTGALTMRMAVYKEFGVIRSDLMQVKLTALPSDFATSGAYIKFYRWQANTSGSTYLDNTALNIKIVNPNTGALILANGSYVRWSDLSTAASGLGYTSPTSFLTNMIIIADTRDPMAQFDVLMAVVYNADGSKKDTVNALMPLFAADPTVYANDNGGTRNASLQALHPFKDKVGQGWTATDYQTWSNNFCAGFTL